MKKLILLLATIAVIEWNLQWNGLQNTPNQVKAWDTSGNLIEVKSSWQATNNGFYWTAETIDGQWQGYLGYWVNDFWY